MPLLDLKLARRIEESTAAAAADLARMLGRIRPGTAAAAEPIAGGFAIYAGIGSPLTAAGGIGFDGEVAETDLDHLEAFFRARGVTTRIQVCPLAHRSLFELLGRRGYRLGGFEQVLARDLARGEADEPAAPDPATRRATPRITARPVTPSESDLWVRTAARGFFEPGPVPPSVLGLFEVMGVLPDLTRFLAFVDGEPAGAAAVGGRDRLASLLAAGTLRSFRGRGVHRELLRARLAHARAAGCDLAVLTADPGSVSERNASRLGLRTAYTRVGMVFDDRGGSEMLLHY